MTPERIIGRYAVFGEIASGGMATVHLGRLLGQVGFARTVAVKRMHPHFAKDPEFRSMFVDEARLAGRIQHPNAVSTLDVVAMDGELFLVMEYVHGESLSRLFRRARSLQGRIAPNIASSVVCGALHGLHAAHEARSVRGEPLGIVHRDISPHNIMVGLDGLSRVLDFGVAKAVGRLQTTQEGQAKGKLPYMAPEQLQGSIVDRRVDVYAAAVVLWEALTGRPLFRGDNEGAVITQVLSGASVPPSRYAPDIPPIVDDLVMRGLSLHPSYRPASARELAVALEESLGVASQRQVGEWVERLAGDSLSLRAEIVEELESVSSELPVPAAAVRGSAPSTPHVVAAQLDALADASTVAEGAAAPSPPEPASAPAQIASASSSQLSSISVSKPGRAKPLESPTARLLALLGGLVLLGVVVVLSWVVLRGPSASTAAPMEPAVGGGPASQPASAGQSGGPATSVPPAPSASVTASTSAATSPADAGATDKPRPRRPPVRRPPRTKPKATATSPVRFQQPD